MNLKSALLLPLLFALTTIVNAQSKDSKFAQFILINIENREQAIEIDLFIRKQHGVEISRTDIHSKKYLCIYNSSSGITKTTFETWMQELGMEIKCFREGKFGLDKIIDQKMDCE